MEKHLSMSPLMKLINDSGFAPEEIAVFFDYDGTLSEGLKVPMVNSRGEPVINSKTGLQGTQTVGVLRGGESTLKVLKDFISKGTPWFVNTARGAGTTDIIKTSMKNLSINRNVTGEPIDSKKITKEGGIPFSVCINSLPALEYKECLERKFKANAMGVEVPITENGAGVSEMGITNNIISAGYEKDYSTEYVLRRLPSMPNLVIFVDDNAMNIDKMYKHMKANHDNVHFIGVVIEPFTMEDDHMTAMEELNTLTKGDGSPLMETISEEYMSGGRRSRRRKQSHRRRRRTNRKSQKNRAR